MKFLGSKLRINQKCYREQPGGTQAQELERSSVEKRFAYNLLEKLIMYLEQAAGNMKPIKPSQGFTRRRSFKKASKDVKFFGKVSLVPRKDRIT